MRRIWQAHSDLKVRRLHSQARSLANKFKQGGKRNQIDEAIALDREALDRCPLSHPMRLQSLALLSGHLLDRYDQFGDLRDVEEGIVLDRAALGLYPPGHPDRHISLCHLARGLSSRYKRMGAMKDLDEATMLNRDALTLRPPGHPERSTSLINLADNLHSRYNNWGVLKDLDEAIALSRDALALRPLGHPVRSLSLNSLANSLQSRHNKLGAMKDLDDAISLNRDALVLCPQGHPYRSISLHSLADSLYFRYSRLGEIKDMDEAIALNRDALKLQLPGHPHRSASLNSLANNLHSRYNKLGETKDLDESIALNRDTLTLRPPEHPDRSSSLTSLASNLQSRYNKMGEIKDLDESIALNREALGLRPPGHPDRSMSLNNLASGLQYRCSILGAIKDLDEAIELNRNALELRPQGHPDRSMSLNNLAKNLLSRYNTVGTIDDLDEAIALNRKALKLRPKGHPYRSTLLNSLANNLQSRYNNQHTINDLDEAIALNRDALALRPAGHPYRFSTLNKLADNFHSRYNELGGIADLDEAISFGRDTLALCPSGHPHRPGTLQNLALCLHARFKSLGRVQDQEELFALYAQLADMPQLVTSFDMSTARAWISMAEDFKHSTTVLAYGTCLELLIRHLASLPTLPRHINLFRNLTSSLAVDAFSACLRNQSLTKAVELLEQGRGVFLSQLARLRSPVEDVMTSGVEGKALADGFMQLTSQIRTALNSPDAGSHDRVFRLKIELERVVSDIRKLPGFSHFLLPLPFSDIRKAAIGGPVIIVNASKYSCDALIIFLDQDPVHIPLQITQDDVQTITLEILELTELAKTMGMGKYFAVVLWEGVVSPIVDYLKTVVPLKSRIWWCPTAEFSLLPFHAAGAYRKDQPKLSDLYISSYTSTLTALIRARQQEPLNCATQGKRFIAIGQANAAGESELQSVGSELTNIGERIDGRAIFTRIEGSDSCITQMIEALGSNEWVHLACHGLPNREQPFESAFGLYDGHLTIERIIHRELKSAEFAYLSACHTTVGDKDCVDEMIHLASAMQFAGFRSVIGTMWAVDDEQTIKITSKFYESMIDESGRLDHTRAAFALHKTMRELAGLSFDQRILYVHLGV